MAGLAAPHRVAVATAAVTAPHATPHGWLLHTLQLVATVTSFMLAASPLPEINRIRASRTTGKYRFAPYFSMALNYALGMAYGFATDDGSIVFARAVSLLMAVGYMYVFVLYLAPGATATKEVAFWVAFAVIFSVGLSLTVNVLLDAAEFSTVIGSVALMASVFMAASPLLNLPVILATRDASSIPFAYTVMGIVCNSSWGFYGLLKGDLLLAVQNFVGVGFSCVQLVLLWRFPGDVEGGMHPRKKTDTENLLGASAGHGGLPVGAGMAGAGFATVAADVEAPPAMARSGSSGGTSTTSNGHGAPAPVSRGHQ